MTISPQMADLNISANPPRTSKIVPGQKDANEKVNAKDWLTRNKAFGGDSLFF
jgi:hypothetical protein